MMIPGDDGGSFERLVREADEAAEGNEVLKERLLTERIVREFAYRLVEVRAAAARANNKSKKVPSWGFDHVPTRTRRGSCSYSKPPQPQADHYHDHRNKRRCFDQIHTSSSGGNNNNNNNNIVQEQKKMRKVTTKANINKNKNRTAATASQEVVAIAEMPRRFKNKIQEMGGSKIVLVIQKQLMKSDTVKQNNRFSIPFKQIENNFLEPAEKQWVVDREEPMDNVRLIEPCLNKVAEVTLKKWDMNGTPTLNLITTWHKEVVCNAANQLQIGSTVQLYAFRLEHNNNELCFALVNLDLVN